MSPRSSTSSGTTGTPKGVEPTHRALIGGLAPMAALPRGLRHDELVLGLPIAHIMGFISVLGRRWSACRCTSCVTSVPTGCSDVIEQRRSSAFMGVPATYRLLDEAGAAAAISHPACGPG